MSSAEAPLGGAARPRRPSIFSAKRLVVAAVSAALLAWLVARVDGAALWAALRQVDLRLLAAALVLFAPQLGLMALRWSCLVEAAAPGRRLPVREALRQVLAGQTLNLVFPSKLGDLAKGLFVARAGWLPGTEAGALVVFEKLLDVAGLAALMLLGCAGLAWGGGQHLGAGALKLAWAAAALAAVAVGAVAALYLVPWQHAKIAAKLPAKLQPVARVAAAFAGRAIQEGGGSAAASRSFLASRTGIIGQTVLLWLLHLGQIGLFFLAVGARPPLAHFLSMAPLAIFTGLLPISFAGFGTRDAAFIAYFPMVPAPVMLAASLLINLRYVVPALLGLPVFNTYLGDAVAARKPRPDLA